MIREAALLLTTSAHRELRRRQLAEARKLAIAARNTLEDMLLRPADYIALSAEVGSVLGSYVGSSIANELLSRNAKELGRLTGEMLGQILFEILFCRSSSWPPRKESEMPLAAVSPWEKQHRAAAEWPN